VGEGRAKAKAVIFCSGIGGQAGGVQRTHARMLIAPTPHRRIGTVRASALGRPFTSRDVDPQQGLRLIPFTGQVANLETGASVYGDVPACI